MRINKEAIKEKKEAKRAIQYPRAVVPVVKPVVEEPKCKKVKKEKKSKK